MFVVRYVALLALVLWLGALLHETAWIRGPVFGFACGAVLLISLVALKFLGPPPPSFVPRAAIVALMLCIALYAHYGKQPAVTMANLVLGGVLLGWYARE